MHKLNYRNDVKRPDGADSGRPIVALALTGVCYALGHVVAEAVIGYFLEIQFCMFAPRPTNPVQQERLVGKYVGDVFFEIGMSVWECGVIVFVQVLFTLFGKKWPTLETAPIAVLAGAVSDAIRWVIYVLAMREKRTFSEGSDWLVALTLALIFALASRKRRWK